MKSKSMGFEWIGRIKQFEGIFAVLRAIGNHVRNLKNVKNSYGGVLLSV